jgi:hypothetical protein
MASRVVDTYIRGMDRNFRTSPARLAAGLGLAAAIWPGLAAVPVPAMAQTGIIAEAPATDGTIAPYGPGFDTGVVIGPRDGCRSVVNCAAGDFRNRPAHRRYYDNYFDVPVPTYSGQRRIGGTPSIGPTGGIGAVDDHRGWCASRYRSYRASDDTYQPYEGNRTPCFSPF